MFKLFYLLAAILLLYTLQSCVNNSDRNSKKTEMEKAKIDKGKALEIANEDASKVYRDLSRYEISIDEVKGDWQVKYLLKDRSMLGGGPYYIISSQTGEILLKKYYQ